MAAPQHQNTSEILSQAGTFSTNSTMLNNQAIPSRQRRDDLCPSQPANSRAITQTIVHCFSTNPDVIAVKKADLVHIAAFPGVVSAIDGTHVRIVAPREQESLAGRQWLIPASLGSSHHTCDLCLAFKQGIIDAKCCGRGIGQLKRCFHVLHGEVRISPPVKVCMMIHQSYFKTAPPVLHAHLASHMPKYCCLVNKGISGRERQRKHFYKEDLSLCTLRITASNEYHHEMGVEKTK
ncbi:hypothetical protein E2C01_034271 [Portunus trituberculatus]|uniref:DDE Tnp4 domain-containing protein n=1 Tax=Portunus trituberculatus TaxID=210409 RepID=A0A5B7F5Q6_PORTR|nr:hypothetical protein [Portunus trituberculatus]